MANERTQQTSCTLENSDEDQENVALGDTATAGIPKIQVGCTDSLSSTDLSKPLSGTFTSTPAPSSSSREVEVRSRLFGLQSALTPNFKIFNISNKSASDKSGISVGLNSPHLTFNRTTAYQIPGLLIDDKNDSACWVCHETLPEVSLLDDTCDSTLQSARAAAGTTPNAKVVDTPARAKAPQRWLDDQSFSDLTLLEVTQDSELLLGGNISTPEIQGDNLKISTSFAKLGENMMLPSGSDINQTKEFSFSDNSTDTITSMSLQVDVCAGETKVSLTEDISLGSENSGSSTGPSEGDVRSQTLTEDTLGIHPANVTHDISSSSDMSAASLVSTTHQQVLASSTFELHGEPVGPENENLPTSCDTEMTCTVMQPRSEDNNQYIVAQSSINGTTKVNTTIEISSSLNNGDVANDTKEQDNLATRNTTDSFLKMNQNSSANKSVSLCDVQNHTFDQYSIQTSSDSTGLQEAVLLNNTFDKKTSPKQNSTVTLSEATSGDTQQATLDKSSLSEVCGTTTRPKDCNSEVHTSEPSKHDCTPTSTEPKVVTAELPVITSESNPVVKTGSEAEHHDTLDHSQPDLPVAEGSSDSLGPQSMETENSKGNTFNLDDTLDLNKVLPSSTPVQNCKIAGAQKILNEDGPDKPSVQVPSAVPSNIVCNRKTFFRDPATKSHLPHFKAPTYLKSKPGHGSEPPAAGLDMARSRTHILKNTTASDPAQGISGKASAYNLRSTTAGSKHPTSGLPRPQTNGIPSSIQRFAPSLRPPLTRSAIPTSSNTGKLGGPTDINPLVKTSQGKKHLLNRVESLPLTKRKKIDAEASCDAAGKAKCLRLPATFQRGPLPKPPAHGCTKCIDYEEEIKKLKDENKQLKEDVQNLLKMKEK